MKSFVLLLALFWRGSAELTSPTTISWNITAVASLKKGGKKTIIESVQGDARRGKLHVILGPSGSGKTTLLNILANAVPKKSMELTGDLLFDSNTQSIFVQQEDLLFAQLTVDETLDTSATLRMKGSNADKKRATVDKMILELNLKKARDTKVGDTKTRGISGGEKKRLCIGNECIGTRLLGGGSTNPPTNAKIFADEPTSGLDSYQAWRAVELLKDLATNGDCTVIAFIHQPRATIFALFDDITLLADGQCMYSGSAKEMSHWFRSLGYPCPKDTNPAGMW